MTHLAEIDYRATILNEDLTVSQILSIRRRVLSSSEERAAFKAFCDDLDTAGEAGIELAMAVSHWINGHWQKGADLAMGCASKPVAAYVAARCLLAAGRAADAAVILGGVVGKLDSDDAYAVLSRALRTSGDSAAAAAALKAGRRKFAKSAVLLAEAGILAELKGDSEEAVENYQEALKNDPECVEALFRLAYVCDLRGDNEIALALYRRCVRIKPVAINALVNLAMLCEETGSQDEAVHCLRVVAESFPRHRRVRLYLKDALASQDMYFDEELQKRRERRNKILEIPISDFELSVRSRNCLERMNVSTLGDLTRISEQALLSFKNFGETSLGEIKQMMSSKGLHLGQALEDNEKKPGLKPRPAAKKAEDSKLLSRPVEDLGLSVRSRHCMQTLGIATVGDLLAKSEKELLGAKNFGSTSLVEVRKKLAAHGLGLTTKA